MPHITDRVLDRLARSWRRVFIEQLRVRIAFARRRVWMRRCLQITLRNAQDHHEGYVSWPSTNRSRNNTGNQQVHRNQQQDTQGPSREGWALLQGLLRCSRCGRCMRRSPGDKPRSDRFGWLLVSGSQKTRLQTYRRSDAATRTPLCLARTTCDAIL